MKKLIIILFLPVLCFSQVLEIDSDTSMAATFLWDRGSIDKNYNYGSHIYLRLGQSYQSPAHTLIFPTGLNDTMQAYSSYNWQYIKFTFFIASTSNSPGAGDTVWVVPYLLTTEWKEGSTIYGVGCGATGDSANAYYDGTCGGTPTDWVGDFADNDFSSGYIGDTVLITGPFSLGDSISFTLTSTALEDTLDNIGVIFRTVDWTTGDEMRVYLGSDDNSTYNFRVDLGYTEGEESVSDEIDNGLFRGVYRR